jgi:cell division septum initiation protein DivIVA
MTETMTRNKQKLLQKMALTEETKTEKQRIFAQYSAEAQAQAQQIIAQAQHSAEETTKNAEARAARIIKDANTQADTIIAAARQREQSIIDHDKLPMVLYTQKGYRVVITKDLVFATEETCNDAMQVPSWKPILDEKLHIDLIKAAAMIFIAASIRNNQNKHNSEQQGFFSRIINKIKNLFRKKENE